jgi:hypothetical protein
LKLACQRSSKELDSWFRIINFIKFLSEFVLCKWRYTGERYTCRIFLLINFKYHLMECHWHNFFDFWVLQCHHLYSAFFFFSSLSDRACKRCIEFQRLLCNWRIHVTCEWCIQEKGMSLSNQDGKKSLLYHIYTYLWKTCKKIKSLNKENTC